MKWEQTSNKVYYVKATVVNVSRKVRATAQYSNIHNVNKCCTKIYLFHFMLDINESKNSGGLQQPMDALSLTTTPDGRTLADYNSQRIATDALL